MDSAIDSGPRAEVARLYGVTNLGVLFSAHSTQRVREPASLLHGQVSSSPSPRLSLLATQSGATAIKAALKIVCRHRTQNRTSSRCRAHTTDHGRTFGAIAATKSKTIYAHVLSPQMVCPSPWMRLMSEHTRGPTMRHYHIQDHPPRDQSSDRGELQSVARDIVEGI